MKIATFNVNNVNKRLANLLGWLRRTRPDVACLQELKATDREFPFTAIKKADYGAVWRGEKSWNGVAILGRGREPVVTRTDLAGDPDDRQGRYIEAAVNGVLIATLYAPNGNPQPGPKFENKLVWMKRLVAHAAELYALDAPVVLAGDFNVVPTDADIYPSKSYKKNALVQPEPRALFRRLLDQGWVDAIRTKHPDTPMYTFWDYKRNCWERDAGLRLDHLLLNPKAAKRLVDAGVDREVRGLEGASDHVPAWILLSDKPVRRRQSVSAQQSRSGLRPSKRRGVQRQFTAIPSWSLMAIYSRTALIMPCRKPSWVVAGNRSVPFSALRICCCASTAWSSARYACRLGHAGSTYKSESGNQTLISFSLRSQTPALIPQRHVRSVLRSAARLCLIPPADIDNNGRLLRKSNPPTGV